MRATTPEVVLVVDDDALLRMHAANVLEDAGYDVLEAEDARAAIEILNARTDVRLLFTDVQMPGCNGVELAREVHERWPNVLLLVTSGGVSLKDSDLPDAGRFLGKPYPDETIVDQVDDMIASSPRVPGEL